MRGDMSERLQKFLARAGIASRRGAEGLIEAGRVTVNGERAELGRKVSAGDEVRFDGEPVSADASKVVYMLNKPPGVLSTVHDDRGRKTVMDLLPPEVRAVPGLHPVGRLDSESEGLLLLTNDGELTLQLTHPRYEHEKEYRVWCREGTLEAWALGRLEGGVDLDDGLTRAKVAKVADGGCRLVLTEGRNRQVRRMMTALGLHVTRLQRTRVGGLKLGSLALGGVRRLSPDDLRALGYTRK